LACTHSHTITYTLPHSLIFSFTLSILIHTTKISSQTNTHGRAPTHTCHVRPLRLHQIPLLALYNGSITIPAASESPSSSWGCVTGHCWLRGCGCVCMCVCLCVCVYVCVSVCVYV